MEPQQNTTINSKRSLQTNTSHDVKNIAQFGVPRVSSRPPKKNSQTLGRKYSITRTRHFTVWRLQGHTLGLSFSNCHHNKLTAYHILSRYINTQMPSQRQKHRKSQSSFAAPGLEYICVFLLLQITSIKSKFTSKHLCRCVEIQHILQTSSTLIKLHFFFFKLHVCEKFKIYCLTMK